MAPRMRRRITSAKREQIEKEQEALSRSINRPFDVLAGLPVSYSTPPYGNYEEVLKNPLTVKDSGILYRSLMKSRNNYVSSCPMFKLYWVKQSSYARKLMGENKLVKAEHTDRPPILGPDVNARDVMVKLCDSGMTLGPHVFEVRIFIAKDDRSKKSDEEEEIEAQAEAKAQENDGNGPSDGQGSTDVSVKKENVDESSRADDEKVQSNAVDPTTATAPTTSATAPVATVNNSSQVTNAAVSSQATNPLSSQGTASAPNSSIQTSIHTSSQGVHTPDISTGPLASEKQPKPKKRAANDLESPDNKLMIGNLNAVAKVDLNLRELMKVISQGTATTPQLIRFSGYVSRAREMGAPPHPFLVPNFRMDPWQPFRYRKPYTKVKDKKGLKLSKIPTKEQRLTAFQEKYFSDATLVFEFVENPNIRYLLPKYAICEVLVSKLSSDERDILISFLWIHNQSELDSYEKQLEAYNDAIKEKEKKEKEEEDKKKADEEREKQIAEGKIPEGSDTPETISVEAVAPASARTRRRPAPKKWKKPAARTPKALVPPVVPELKFTPVSFVVHDIPLKFVPIVTNSFKNQKESSEFMKNVIEKGTKSSALNLWYQVDGKLDEELAENTRIELNNEEKKILGSNAALAAKKRKL